MLITQLQSIYPTLILSKPAEMSHPEDFQWYETPSNETIAISKEELTDKDEQLLSLFLSPLSLESHWGTDRERAWYHYLKEDVHELTIDAPLYYRFVFFSIADLPMNKDSFHEAFQSLFPERMPILFESDDQGFIIEEFFSDQQDMLSFDQMIDVLMSDFYTKIRFYISEISSNIHEAPSLYRWAEHNFRLAGKYQPSSVATYKDTMPFLYIDALPASHQKRIQQTVLHQVIEEPDLLQTVKTFLESGSNATLAAKKLFMHRNSLQYRVDKFIEKTGLDVKQFEGAVITYLALLSIGE
ncbi:helix-turn-helix domain-containing protein [Halobacillus locisalis]|uniref:Helix-turn-helix domain-containing protein n=1 Tax=Halobacillus locisalis TaxID=220753 RepID=A0A838CS38_9BACI|nr:helix-turn-helix domain-containing protein [Halobacillus locisalis]MBA2174585.1 helix-turn-helix domain-containing protein [Halobacillus locisalis]